MKTEDMKYVMTNEQLESAISQAFEILKTTDESNQIIPIISNHLLVLLKMQEKRAAQIYLDDKFNNL